MGFGKSLRERSSLIRFLVEAQKTVWYPVLFAVLCVISGTNNHTVYLPIMYLLCAFVIFSALFTDDTKVFITPLLMMFYGLGNDADSDTFVETHGDMLSCFEDGALVQLIIIGAISLGALIVRLIADGSLSGVFKKRGFFTYSILALDIAFILNGIFGACYRPINLLYGVVSSIAITAVYVLACSMLDRSSDPVGYSCYAMVATAYVALCQILIIALREYIDGSFFVISGGEISAVNRNVLNLAWGVPTVVAAVFALGIPAAMYLAKEHRFSLFSFVSAIFFIAGSVIINTRSAMLVGAAIFLACAIICCIKGKNRQLVRIYSAVTSALLILGVVYIHCSIISLSSLIPEILDILRLDGSNDSVRLQIWKDAIKDFSSSPIFGIGFNDGGFNSTSRFNNMYSNMYHCILLQIPASLGVVGCLAFIFHTAQLVRLTFKRFKADTFIVMLIPFMILGMSLVDNFFFYPTFQIFYALFLALAEQMSNRCENNAITENN